MTSSSNVAGDIKQGLSLRKVNSKYFSFKWKRDSGESGGHDNNSHTKLKFNEFVTVDTSFDVKNTDGFFKNIKKKLSMKNFYRSKRKIITMDSSNCLDASGSSLMTNTNGRPVSSNDERNNIEINDRIGTINLTIGDNTEGQIQNSKNKANNEYSSSNSYLNFQPNINNIESNVDNSHENSQDCRINETNENISHTESHVNNIENHNIEDESVLEDIERKCTTNLSQELQKLRKYGWYWGNTSGDVADAALLSEPDGAFLIRDSSDCRHLLTLSFKSAGKLLHARVEHSGGMFSLCNQGESGRFSSVPELIDHSMNFSKYAVFCYSRPRHPGSPAFPVRLTKPISRFNRVRSLQYLCRFVIRQNTRWDNIHKLPLPKSLRIYIEEGHYL